MDAAHGHPVVQATVDLPRRGLRRRARLPIQLVSHSTPTEPTQVVCDVPPQMADSGMPYMSFGTRPMFFDAPADSVPCSQFRATALLDVQP